jgi:hypothetical protein
LTVTGGAAEGAAGGAEALALPLERRKFRTGEDGDVGGGSGASQVNAAAETVGVEGSGADDGADEASSVVDVGRNSGLSIGDPVSCLAGTGSFTVGESPGSLGVRSCTPGETGADTGRLKLNGDASRGDPMLSAGRAGMASADAAAESAPAGATFPLPSGTGPPLEKASLAGTGVRGVCTDGTAIRSDGWVSWS